MHKLKNLTKKAPKSKEELNAILFSKGKIVATDSYKLLEIAETGNRHDINLEALIPTHYFKAGDTVLAGEAGEPMIYRKDGAQIKPEYLDPTRFPKYEEVMPSQDRPAVKMSVNRQFLIDLLEAMPKSKDDEVVLNISTDKPDRTALLITNQDAKALLMPLNK